MKGSTEASNAGMGLAIATLVAILATLIVNSLSNFFPPQGANIGQIANTELRAVQVLPANYAFAIWGLIYLGLIAYGIYQLRPDQHSHPTIQRVSSLLIVACVAQMVWVYLFTVRLYWLSVVAMLLILLPLIGAYLNLNNGRWRETRAWRWLVQIPFSIYLAWISVATVVNVASALYASNWNGWGLSSSTWTVIMLVIITLLGALMILQRQDLAFTLVLVWALVAIAIRQSDTPLITWTAAGAAIILSSLGALGKIRTRQLPHS